MLALLALAPPFLLALLINLILLFASSVLFSSNFVALYCPSVCFTQIFNLHKCNTTYVAILNRRDINVKFIRAQSDRHKIPRGSDNTAMAHGDEISDAQYQSLWDRIRSGEGMNLWSKAGRRPSAEEETAIYSATITCKPLSTSSSTLVMPYLQAKLSDHRFPIAKHDTDDKKDADSYGLFGLSPNLLQSGSMTLYR